MSILEESIAVETEYMKKVTRRQVSMSDSQHYFLNGVQAAPVTKFYLLTKKGIEVVGEEAVPISAFIDQALNFANYPKKRLKFDGYSQAFGSNADEFIIGYCT